MTALQKADHASKKVCRIALHTLILNVFSCAVLSTWTLTRLLDKITLRLKKGSPIVCDFDKVHQSLALRGFASHA
jgi:hypothetical protein